MIFTKREVLGLLLLLSCGCSQQDVVEDSDGGISIDNDFSNCPAFEIINAGHRGTGRNEKSNPFPENTLLSIRKAIEEGADVVEVDVHYSSDDILVVMHDETVDRTTNGAGCVSDFSVEQLKQLDAALGTDFQGTDVTVPTLQEVIDAVDVGINIEAKVKAEKCPGPNIEKLASDLIEIIHADKKRRAIFVSSPSPDLLQTLVPSDIYLVLHKRDPELAAQLGIDAVNVAPDENIVESIRVAREFDLDTLTVTADREIIRVAINAGITVVLTDDPDVMREEQLAWCENNGYSE
jgi:glycerophosphoryl diester phosphodiesterase